MKVYRIQHIDDYEIGAYSSGAYICNIMAKQHKHDKIHPAPTGDNGINRSIAGDEFCGFIKPAQLLKWFRGYIPQLLSSGFEIACLKDVTITAIGEYQTLFKFNDMEDLQ